MKVEGFVYDIEADGFYFQATKIWTICFLDLNDKNKKLKVNPFRDPDAKQKIQNWFSQYEKPLVVGHNILGYDQFVQRKLLEIDFSVGPDTIMGKPVQFFDTYYASMYTNPDADGHGIAAWGERLGLEKIDWRQRAIDLGLIDSNAVDGAEFQQHHEEMDTYCERDTEVNLLVFWNVWKTFNDHYKVEDKLPDHFRCGQKQFYLMSCQEITGWKFDKVFAEELKQRIQTMMSEIEMEVEPQLPPRKLKKSEQNEYTMPMKPFKKDGTFSSHMLNFIAKHNGEVVNERVVRFYGVEVEVESNKMLEVSKPMTLGNQDDLKEWLLEKGWSPTLWNYKRGPDGKPMRDPLTRELIQTTPKMQEAGKICPNLFEMDGVLVGQVVKWLSLRNRLSVLEGWLSHWRLSIDGRLPTSRTGITPTHRQKHNVVVNVPKASDKVLLGKEFRSLFVAEDGWFISAGDASALEGRVEGSYTFKYDNGKRASIILDGDEHSNNAKIFYPEETVGFDPTSENFNKDDPKFKPFRDRSKNGRYGLTYGCNPPKLAKILGKPEKDAEKLYKAFWDGNPSLKLLKDAVEKFWNSAGEKKWLPAIDRRRLFTRKKSALLNTLFQSCGAIAMDYASCYMDCWLGGIKWVDNKPTYIYKGVFVRRIGFFHDELEYEVNDLEIAVEVAKLIEKAIVKAGEHLKLSVPLAGEGKVGKNWMETH